MIEWLTRTFIGKLAATVILSMVPVIELRGGIPYGVGFGLPYPVAFIAAFIGNMIPVPFIILLLRRIFDRLRQHGRLGEIIERLETRAQLKGEKVRKFKKAGLFILVAIPLPGTGAWTGALVASVLDMRLKDALPAIALGVLTAGFIVLGLTHGVISAF